VEIEMDLVELKNPFLTAKRVFLTGANPIGLSFNKLKTIGEKIKSFLPCTAYAELAVFKASI